MRRFTTSALLLSPPPWAWAAIAAMLLLPLYLAYFATVLRWAGVLAFWTPVAP